VSPPRLRWTIAAALVLLGIADGMVAGYSGQERLATMAIFAILAMSLDLLVGFAGLVSLGHALFFGLGAYAMAGLTQFAQLSAAPAMALAVLSTGAAAWFVGALVVRLGGVFFIMITLAAGQMAFAYFEKARLWGGNGGMAGVPRLELDALGLDLGDPGQFALAALAVAALVFAGLDLVVRSPFGQVLAALHQNENRARALGCPVGRYKLAAFALSGMLAGLAGTMMAQLTGFVSPDLLIWTNSGEILIMVIVGGVGSLVGPAAGAALWILLRNALAGLTTHWMFAMGLFFIAVVLLAEQGLFGALTRLRTRRRRAA
jgi:branched-chain amino acid transport system permease protein